MSEGAKWTTEQLEAITERGCNLLVAAAAGAGKTSVLVGRIIERIVDERSPTDIDRLLVVTFTNAAAAEMRERILEAVSSALEKDPGSKKIQRQLALIGKANITTMHSFCLEVVRSNFQSVDIDPDFRIADETEASLMKLEVLEELFNEQYENDAVGQDFIELLERYGGNRDDQHLRDMALELFDFIQSSPWPDKWLDEMSERFNLPEGIDLGDTPWGKVLLDSAALEIEGMRSLLGRALEVLAGAAGLEKYKPVFSEDMANLDLLVRVLGSTAAESGGHSGVRSWDRFFEALSGIEFGRLPVAGRDADREKQEFVKNIRDEVRDGIKKLKESIVNTDSREALGDLGMLYPALKCLTGLVTEFSARYAERKKRKSVLDFNDLEHFCLKILTEADQTGGILPSAAALDYRARFDEVLVDEYQDSNLVQELIIGAVSKVDAGKPNVFMVGDVKQSIYRFRQAKPELFLEKYDSYSMKKGDMFRKILLYKNFRSRREVVDAVNFIFRQVMSRNAGELDYTEDEALIPGAVYPACSSEKQTAGGVAELHLIQTDGSEDERGDTAAENGHASRDADCVGSGAGNGDGGSQDGMDEAGPEASPLPASELDSMQCEARFAAQRIRELMKPDDGGRQFCVFDRKLPGYRNLEYRDIVILLRATRGWSDAFLEELALQGIPAFADTGAGFFKTSEVQVVLSLLQIIDNPLQDIPLLSVLRSPIAAFTTDELAELRLADRKAPLYEALVKLSANNSGQTSAKAAAFLDRLRGWRDISCYLSTDRLIWELYDETGFYSTVGAMPAGEQRQANLRILFERARQFENTGYKGLFNFINFIDKMKSGRGDMGGAKILGESDNVVRIMSIHKSKGLEFPVVFLCGCGKKFNLQDMNKGILLHQELGFGPDVADYVRRLSYPSVAKLAIRDKIKSETLSEEMRILYVALTRAREKLIISGTVGNVAGSAAKWARCASVSETRLPSHEILKGSRYLDWIGPALLRHECCGGLRDILGAEGGFKETLLKDPSEWSVRVWDKSRLQGDAVPAASDKSDFMYWLENAGCREEGGCREDADCREEGSCREEASCCREDASCRKSSISQEIARRLGWSYKYPKSSEIPAKVSVTELKRRYEAAVSDDSAVLPGYIPQLVKKPGFLETRKGLSAAEAGTVMHFAMQHLDFRRNDLKAQLDEMVANDLLTVPQEQCIDTSKITAFMESPIGVRLLAADEIHREEPFNIEIPCSELFPDMAGEEYGRETMLLQGVIDCWFEEPGGLVLLDYKTDYIPAGGPDEAREKYRLQITYYARALEMLTGKKVTGKYIYLFYNGQIIEY